MVKKVAGENQQNGAGDSSPAFIGNAPHFPKSFLVRDVADLQVDGVQLSKNQVKGGQNGKWMRTPTNILTCLGSSRFRTDTDISGGFVTRERDLKPWDGGADNSVDLSLESGSGGKAWDQFEANERLYGVTTNYDESYYTTTIDKSHPQYKERAAEAERVAREIEGSTAMNSHVAEERGLKDQDDAGEDEESK
jgi:PAB1-binding protein PBP1